MKWKNLTRAAFVSIVRNGMRSLLTMLGMIIGVGAVIVMVALGKGSQAEVEARISSLGVNMITVFPQASSSGGVSWGAGSMTSLTLKDVEALEEQAMLLNGVSPMVMTRAQVIGGVGNWSTTIRGVSPVYPEIRSWTVTSGAMFTDRDVRSGSKVAVLGSEVAGVLFPYQDPVGAKIRIGNVPFKVIGVLSEKGQSFGGSQDDLILAPATTVLYRLKGGQHIDQIVVSAVSEEETAAAQDEMRTILRQAHRRQPGEDDDFGMRTQTEIMEMGRGVTEALTWLLGSIAAVSLVVGGIGIMNIMLVSVTERTREIGLRLAVGGRSRDVLAQFLVEAVVLSLMGGGVGIFVGIGVAQLASRLSGYGVVITSDIVALAFTVSAGVGVFFGYYPARKAAGLNPIDALRHE